MLVAVAALLRYLEYLHLRAEQHIRRRLHPSLGQQGREIHLAVLLDKRA